jgi:ABC-type multidrug transport system fused ATPase/permease subunit
MRTHLSLQKDAPVSRAVQAASRTFAVPALVSFRQGQGAKMSNACEWIGPAAENDGLDLPKISKQVKPEAAALHEILNSAKVSGLLRIRRDASTIAAKAQSDFKRLSVIVIVCTAIATLSSGLLLYGAGSDAAAPAAAVAQAAPAQSVEQGLVQWVQKHRTSIMFLQIISLLAASVGAAVLAGLNLVERWSENRNKAETLRREVFNEVINQAQQREPAPLAAADPGNAIAQALEFFRRYQHELQMRYYQQSGKRAETWTRRLTWLTAILAGLAAVTGMIAGLGGMAVILSAFLGIAVPILLSAAQSWSATSRDNDKAEAYGKARDALEKLLLELDDVRAKAALGDAAEVRKYIDNVHIIMTTETGAWVAAGKP